MSRNRRGHRGGRKHRHNQNNGSQTFQNQSSNSQVYVPKDPFVRNGSKPKDPKKRSFWSFLRPVYLCYVFVVRLIVLIPIFLLINAGMLALTILGCRKRSDSFADLSDIADAVNPATY